MSNLAAPDSPSDDTSVEISNANYHFDAPTYFDFSVPSDAPLNDQWFDEHNDSASTAHDDGYTLGEDVSQTGYSAAEQTPASSYSGRGSQASTGYRVHSAEATPSTALAGLSLQSQLEEAMTHARNPSDAAAIAALCGAKLSIASASSNRPSVASNAPSQSPVKALPLQFIDFSHLQPVEAKVKLPAAERASTGSRKRKSDANARMAAKPPQPKKEKTAATTAKVNAPVASVGARKPVSRPISKPPTAKPVVSKAPAASNTAVLGQKRKSVPFAPKTATAGPSPVVRAAMNKVAGKSVLLAVVKAINNNIAVPIKRVAAPTESKTTAARENSRRNQTRNADKAAAPVVSKSRPAVAAAGPSAAMRAKSSAPAAQPVRKASASVAATKHVVPPRVASASTVAAAAKVAKPKVVAKAAPAPQPRPKITVPKSPKLHVATRVKAADTLSSEEQMLKEMEEAKKQQEMVRKQNAAAVQRVLQPVGQILPTRSTKQLTQPQEFQLFTETRSRRVGKSAEPSTPSMGLSKKPISRQAVSQSADRRKKSPAAMKKPTQPVPFHFELDKRTHKAEAAAPVETPRRITHITRDLEIPVVPSSASKAPLGPDGKPMLTKPISPSLATKARVRAPAVLSFAEQEELEMQQMPKFKARKLNEAVMQSVGDLGLPKVSKPAPTEFQEFHLLTEDRARSRPEAHGELHAPSPFKARPFNPKLFEEVSNEDSKDAPRGVPAVPKKDLTVPVSPNITHPQPRKRKSEEGLQPEFKARPMPENSPFRPVLAKKTKLNVQPFNLLTEERGAQYQSHFQQQLAEEEAAARAAREFRAAPIVEASPMRPEKSNKPLTDPEPFPLQSITRHEANQLRFLEKVHQDIENELAQFSAFKARPMPHADPFLVKKAEKPLTEVEEFELYTELRSKERQTFDEHNKARLAEQERRKQEEEEAAKRQAEVEIAEMRKHMVHKALPIMKGEPLPPAKCDKPLTEPKSPELATKARAVVRKGKEEAVNDENIVLNSADLETY